MIRPQTLVALSLVSLAVLAACAQKKADDPQPRQWHVTVPAIKSEAFTPDEKSDFFKFVAAQETVKMFNPMDYMFTHAKDQKGLSEMQKTLIFAVQSNKTACDSKEDVGRTGDIRHPGELVTVDTKRYIKDVIGRKCSVNSNTQTIVKMTSQLAENNQVLLNGSLDMTNAISADSTVGTIIGAGTTGRLYDEVALTIVPGENLVTMSGTLQGKASGSIVPTGVTFYTYHADSTIWMNISNQPATDATNGSIEVGLGLEIDNPQSKHAVITVRLAKSVDASGKETVQAKEITLNGAVLSGDEEKVLLESELVGRAVMAQLDRVSDVLGGLFPGFKVGSTFSLANQ